MAENERTSHSKSAAGMSAVSAVKKGPMKHKFHMLEIHPASNGFTLKHHPPREEGKSEKAMYMPPPEPTETVWGGDDGQKMLDHIGGLLGVGKAPGNKDQKSGSEKEKKSASGKMDAEDKKGEGDNEEEDEEE